MAGYGRIFLNACSASNFPSLLSTRSCLNNLPRHVSTIDKAMERLGFPQKPKRPLTAYVRYAEGCRKQLDLEEPNLKNNEKMKRLSEKWAVCDPKVKEALQKAYNLDMVAYSKQLMTYEQSITPEQKRALQEELNKEKLRQEKLQLKKKCDELGKPKKPPTGFLQYLQENKYSKSKDERRTDWIRTRAERWREMSDEEKSKYKMESQRLMEQYKQDLRTWEENMVRNGHIDVVRNRGLLDIKYSSPNAE